MSPQHHIGVTVDLQRFADNVRALKAYAAPAKICVVVKSNAYGHGIRALAPVAVEAGADYLGISTNPEAREIRDLGLQVNLMRLRGGLRAEYEESAAGLDIEEQAGTWEDAEFLSTLGEARRKRVRVHINIDTGMGREGFLPKEIEILRRVCALPGLRIAGLMTHFATADGETVDRALEQEAVFDAVAAELEASMPLDAILHTHNSAALMRFPENRKSLVRVGAACYGLRTSQNFENISSLRPVMDVKTWVASVRDLPAGCAVGYGSLFTTQRESRIASLPVGFGEGYPRSLFNKGVVLIQGKRCPVVGRVSLNITTVDVTDLPEPVECADEVVLVGRQGGDEITFEELADRFDSVHTEINLMAGSMNEIRYRPVSPGTTVSDSARERASHDETALPSTSR